jgi:hypothetical protein
LLLLLCHSLADGLLQGLLEDLQSGGWLRSGRGGTHRLRHVELLLLGWWAAVVLLLLHGHGHGRRRGVDGLRLWRQLLLVGLLRLCIGRLSLVVEKHVSTGPRHQVGGAMPDPCTSSCLSSISAQVLRWRAMCSWRPGMNHMPHRGHRLQPSLIRRSLKAIPG